MLEMAKLYEEYRPLLFSLAYQMLGSVMDAEDIVHDTFLSLDNKKGEEIQHIKAYLCRMVTNRCLDYLKSARKKRELYIGPWLPEPLLTEAMEEPLQKYLQKDRISIAFLLLLEKLSPPERCIVVLRDSFSYTFDEISAIVGKTTANCRQIYRRAKAKIHSEGAENFSDELEESMLREKGANQVDSSLLEQLVLAILQGEPEKLSQLLAEDVVTYSDGGGKVKAALQPIYGADRVSRFLLGIASKRTPDITFRSTTINGSPGLVFYVKDSPWSTIAIEMKMDRIQTIYLLMNPDKLAPLTLSEQQTKLT